MTAAARRVLLVLVVGASGLMAWSAVDRSLWWLMILAAFALTGILVLLHSRAAVGGASVFLIAVAVRVFWLPVAPTLSDDSYRYAWDGMIVADGINPFEYPPEDSALVAYHGHPTFGAMNSRQFHSVYPPASQAAFAAADLLTNSAYPASFFALKGILIALELLAIAVLVRLVAPNSALLFACHPVVLIAGGQAHTDVLLALPLVLIGWAAARSKWAVAGVAVALAALTKIWPLLAVPPFLKHRRAVWSGMALGLVGALPFAAPYVIPNVTASLDLYVRYFEFNAGLYYTVKKAFLLATGDDWSKQLGPFFRLLFAGSAVIMLVAAWRRKWSLPAVLFAVCGLQVVFATTVHPWYLYPILLLAAIRERPEWSWQWLAVASVGTYTLYIGGPYWGFVVVGWLGFLVLWLWEYGPPAVQRILQRRARWKADWLVPHLSGTAAVLDVGGGEGYVALEVQRLTGRSCRVVEIAGAPLVDVESDLYDGKQLPYDDDAFADSIVVFTLHHAADPAGLVREMARVTAGRVIVLESVYQTTAGLRRLTVLDRAANRLRSMGRGQGFEEVLKFGTASEWRSLFAESGLSIVAESARTNPLHHKHLFVLEKVGSSSPSV